MYNWEKKNLPPQFESWFTPINDIHSYNTKRRTKLYKNYSKSFTVLKSVRYNGPQFWNTIPSDIKQANSIQPFKKALKNYLVGRS